jgi:integrase
MDEEAKISYGFDRGIDYIPIKDKLINKIYELWEKYKHNCKKIILNRMVYTIICCIQLRCGARISESVKAFTLFVNKGIDNRVIVKISKSDGHYKDKQTGTTKQKKIRYREMMFPIKWFNDLDFWKCIVKHSNTKKLIESGRLKKRVLDYLRLNFDCNTHSLRYAFINYMLYEEKRPAEDIAKYVGHIDTRMLTRYCQQKNCNKIFDLDI